MVTLAGFVTMLILYIRATGKPGSGKNDEVKPTGAMSGTLGFEYSTNNANVAAALASVGKIVESLKRGQCKNLRQAFMEQKSQIISGLRLDAGTATCKDVEAAVRSAAGSFGAELLGAAPGVDVHQVTAGMLAMWDAAAKESCDANGVVDQMRLDRFVTKMYDAICVGG
jgi:hypothetical protein